MSDSSITNLPFTVVTPSANDKFALDDSANGDRTSNITFTNLVAAIQTPWTQDITAGGFNLSNLQFLEFQQIIDTPNTSIPSIFFDSLALTFNVTTGNSMIWEIDGAQEMKIDASELRLTDIDLNLGGPQSILNAFSLQSGGTDALTGFIRMTNTDFLAWRNFGNTDNHTIGFSSDIFQISIDGTPIYNFDATDFITTAAITSGLDNGLVVIGDETNTTAPITTQLNTVLACRVATTTSGVLDTDFEATDVIDGVTLAAGNRILIKDQSVVDSLGLTSFGSGYTSAPTVVFTGPSNVAATASTTFALNGSINTIGGIGGTNSGYTDGETITLVPFTGVGINATATADISGGSIQSVTITNGGTGFTITDFIDIVGDESGSVNAGFSVDVVGGAVTSITLLTGGSGYTSPPDISFTGGSPVLDATAEATVSTAENGIYTVNASGAPTRVATDIVDATDNEGVFTTITEGTENIDTSWVLSTPGTITLDTTDLTFDEFSFADIAHLNSEQTFSENQTIGTSDDRRSLTANGSVIATDTVEYFDGSTQAGAGLVDFSSGDIDTQSFVQDFSLLNSTTPDTTNFIPLSLIFKPDGSKMFVLDETDLEIVQWDVPTPWDLSSIPDNASSSRLITDAGDTNPTEIVFRADGRKAYLLGRGSDLIYGYNLSTPWDLSTMVLSGDTLSVSPSNNGFALYFNPNGKQCFVGDSVDDVLYQFNLTTPWDLTTGFYSGITSLNFGTIIPQIRDVKFRPDGLKFYLCDPTDTFPNRLLAQFTMPAPYDIARATLETTFDSLENDAPTALFFRPDCSKLFTTGFQVRSVFEYDLGVHSDGNSFFNGIAGGLVIATANLTTSGQTTTKITTAAITITIASTDIAIPGKFMIFKTDGVGSGGGNSITITTQGSQLIDGSASDLTITTDFGSFTLFSDGSNLFITSST